MPKQQSRESHAVLVAQLIVSMEAEPVRSVGVLGPGTCDKETGREMREWVGVVAAAVLRVRIWGRWMVAGHLVVYLGKREGSKAAGLAEKDSVRDSARKVS